MKFYIKFAVLNKNDCMSFQIHVFNDESHDCSFSLQTVCRLNTEAKRP